MTPLENYISIGKRRGYEYMPVHMDMCPTIQKKYEEYMRTHDLEIPLGEGTLSDLPLLYGDDPGRFDAYYREKNFKPGTNIDQWGIAHEPGSKYAYHMTYMHHPMENFDSEEQVLAYPFPDFDPEGLKLQKEQAEKFHQEGRAVMGQMQCTIWETAWYLRGMENLMCDMMTEDPIAEVLLDQVTDRAVQRAVSYVTAGADAIFLGDDIGMQRTIMMSRELYGTWIQPRLKRVIDAAKQINPDVLVFYHSCGHVTELIPNLIEAGIDVLNPVQPECMGFKKIHEEYGDRLSFHGTIGTQSTMPFGTPDDVRRTVFENLDIAGDKGGLYVCPTHMLEPEVPIENVIAYIEACKDYTGKAL